MTQTQKEISFETSPLKIWLQTNTSWDKNAQKWKKCKNAQKVRSSRMKKGKKKRFNESKHEDACKLNVKLCIN